MLLYIEGKAIGHCTTHTATFTSDSKERAVKPLASVAGTTVGLWKERSITGLSIQITAEGFVFYAETENGFVETLDAWKDGATVTVKCMRRSEGTSDTPTAYLEGEFTIDSLERTDPAQDDSTYRIQLTNSGQPTTLDDSAVE